LNHIETLTNESLTLIKDFPAVSLYTFSTNKLYFKFKEGSDMELDEMIELTNTFIPYAELGRRFLITDARVLSYNISPEARDYVAKHKRAPELGLRSALLVNSIGIRLVANFFVRFNKPNIPTRLFNDEAKAIEWLNAID
jgi:hypothetical protein